MNLVYNTQFDIANKIRKFLEENTSCLHKPQLNFLPDVIFGMIHSESVVCQDVSLQLKNQLFSAQLE